ncbi:Dps family protein [Fulvivirgaceae bacterium BMA12]|uniref:Dps family protein n=1 Tax=Agaribacillus aureus TaxID=3051825 RepID=A0ABT8LE98_9BACT|nr:Dps family protein [Fulvivirgaceae bacterium BMA12]
MANLNLIGLETEKARKIAEQLNFLLSDLQIYYQNLRGFHWNIQGPEFFDLHQKFEELYTVTAEQIDEIAERVLALEETPFHSFEDYIINSGIKAKTGVHDAKVAVETISSNLKNLIIREKEILKLASDAQDEGTASLVSDMIKMHEKNSWMYRAWLK